MVLAENVVIAGRFRLNRLIGRGGMGSVWHATQIGLDRPCAIKFIEGEQKDQQESRERFEREAKAAAQLHSPNVVQIFDHGICDGTPYIAMELMEGEDLRQRMARSGWIRPDQLVVIVRQVARALTKAHAMGIVHRDLKPDNIFLVRDDDREIVKVLDFGIAKSMSSDLGSGGTKTGAMLGTPYYMSPEQVRGAKALDYRSDLWSLAVIAFECLTMLRPFDSDNLAGLALNIVSEPLPVPSLMAKVPPGFDVWWARAACRDPGGRFQSARELVDSLAVALGVTEKGREESAEAASSVSAMAATAAVVTGPGGFNVTPPLAAPTPHGPSSWGVAPPQGALPSAGATTGAVVSQTGNQPIPSRPLGKGVVVGILAAVAGVAVLLAAGSVLMARRPVPSLGATRAPSAVTASPPAPAVAPSSRAVETVAPAAPQATLPEAAAPLHAAQVPPTSTASTGPSAAHPPGSRGKPAVTAADHVGF